MSIRRLICCVALALFVTAPGFTSARPATPSPGIDSPDTVTRYYTLTVRFRPFLFWMTRDDVGGARISWNSSSGPDRWAELLVGSDPERAPMSINRWGFISEQTQRETSLLTGIMTETDDGWIDGARRNASAAGTEPPGFRAIRSTIRNGEATTSITWLAADPHLTYRDYATALDRLSAAPGGAQHMRLRPGVEPGFLTAVRMLLHESVEKWQREPRSAAATVLRHDYVYAGTLYELALLSAARTDAQVSGRARAAADGQFEIRNTVTGTTTDFRIVYGLSGAEAETPLRVVYRPRWWIELELDLVAPDVSRIAMSDLPRARNPNTSR